MYLENNRTSNQPTVYLYTYYTYTVLHFYNYHYSRYTFSLITGIADEGFEMLEQLAYLYLANNKVSPTSDSQMWI